MNWKFTKIHHPARIAIDLTIPEYCVLDIIYQSQTNPTYSIEGWTDAGCHRIAKFLGLSSGTIHAMYDRLCKNGFLEYKDESKNLKRATAKFYDYAYLDEEDIVQKMNVKKGGGVQKMNTKRSKNEQDSCSENEHPPVQKMNAECSEIEHNGVQKLNDKCSEIEHKLNKLNIELNLTEIEREQTPEIEIFPLETKTDQKETPSAVKVITSKTQLTNAELESDFAFVIAADVFWMYLEQNEGQLDMMKLNTRFSGTNEEVKELVYKFFADKADQNFVLRTPCQRSNIGAITKWMSNQKTFKQPIDPKIVPIQPKRAGQLTNYQNQNQNDLDNGDYVTLPNGTKVTRTQYNRVMARHAPPVSG